MKLRTLSGLTVAALLIAACNQAGASPTPTGVVATPPTGDALGYVQIPAGEDLNIAFWGVLSGSDASLGTDSKRGVELAIEDRGQVAGRDVNLKSEDALCTPAGGATAAQALAADTTLVGLIGSTCSDETVGGIAAITAAGLTTISPSNTRPALTFPDRDPTFAGYLRTAHSDAFQGKAVAEFVFNELGLTTAATIHDGSAYAEALQQVFADEFVALGGTITAQEAVQKEQTDMTPVLTTIAASNGGAAPEVLYYPIFTAEGGFVTAQVRDVAGMEDAVLIGSDGMFSADMVEAAGPNALNMYLSSPDFSRFAGGYATFVASYEAKYGEKPIQIFHAHAYDAANILFDAIEAVAVDVAGTLYIPKQALRDAIYATTDFQGITGVLSCSDSGDCGAPVIAVYQVTQREVDGEWPPEAPIWP